MALLLFVACGSRTGLLAPEDLDARAPVDAGIDRHRFDGNEPDVPPDMLPPIDITPPRDVVNLQCPDAAATLVYVITVSYDLYSFYPPDATFTRIGAIACPAPAGSTPFSMAVDRKGIAYIVFSPDGNLYRVSTATAACQATTFTPGQPGFPTFGMGFSGDTTDTGETLFVAGDTGTMGGASELGSIDVTSFALNPIGFFNPTISLAELTGTGAGDLFAFYSTGADSAIAQIDKATATVTGSTPLPGVSQGSAWAFAFWGGDFYTFTSPAGNNGSDVTRYRPSDNSITVVTTMTERIVGAGVSTCAPQQ